jgi:DNA-binding response OmpR family regulator
VKKILVMDDSPLFLDVARVALESVGFRVLCATNLSDLEQVQRAGPADLVLMDVQMPEAFGDDVALALRRSRGVSAPIYLLSSLDDADLAERVAWAEIEGFISKNLGIEAMVEKVQAILGPAAGNE